MAYDNGRLNLVLGRPLPSRYWLVFGERATERLLVPP